tara:strand:- start:10613 stop:10903 length:291 start_codon:yes stop_codon:yes gene_type:complete
MSHYLIAQIDIVDRETYAKYEAGFMDIFSRFDGTVLSVDEAPKLLEGSWAYTRTVLISFPSEQQALDWYQSDDYQELAKFRFAASSANIAMIKGLD